MTEASNLALKLTSAAIEVALSAPQLSDDLAPALASITIHEDGTILADRYAPCSLRARLVIALRALERYCSTLGLEHPKLAEFTEYFSRLPLAINTPDDFETWFRERPEQADFAPLDEASAAILEAAASRGVPPAEFTRLLQAVGDIAFGSFYAAPDDPGSLRELDTALRIVGFRGVPPPPVALVAHSRFEDGTGWGLPIDDETLHRWRSLGDTG